MSITNVISRAAPLSAELGELAARLREQVVSIQSRAGGGAGVIWSSTPAESLIVTNDHVVRGEQAGVVLASGERINGAVLGRDRENDLAALRLERGGLPAATAGDSDGLRVGQLVLALGHPFGVEHALTAGIVSALPQVDEPRALVRADLTLNPGNSGGPLTDAQGRVVGINAMVASPRVALAVPSRTVQVFLARLIGPIIRLGVTAQPVPLPAQLQARLGLELPIPSGLLILGVESGSPAEAAGLLPGDVIVGAAGRPVGEPSRLFDALAFASTDQPLHLSVIRAGRQREIDVRLASQEGSSTAAERRAA